MYIYDLREWAKWRVEEIYEEVQKCKTKKTKTPKQLIALLWKKIR